MYLPNVVHLVEFERSNMVTGARIMAADFYLLALLVSNLRCAECLTLFLK